MAGSLSYNIPNSSSKRVTQRDNLSMYPLEPSLGTFQTQTLGHGEVRGPCAFADFDELFNWALPRSDVCMTPLAGQSTPVPFFGPRPSPLFWKSLLSDKNCERIPTLHSVSGSALLLLCRRWREPQNSWFRYKRPLLIRTPQEPPQLPGCVRSLLLRVPGKTGKQHI